MASPLRLDVEVIWKTTGIDQIIAEAERQISRLQAAGHATPGNVAQITGATQGAVYREVGNENNELGRNNKQRAQAYRDAMGKVEDQLKAYAQAIGVQTQNMTAAQWTHREFKSLSGVKDLSTTAAGHNAALDAAEQREIQIETLKTQLSGDAAAQIATEVQLRKQLWNDVQKTAGHQEAMAKIVSEEVSLENRQRSKIAQETLSHPERIRHAAQATLDDRQVDLAKRQLVAQGTDAGAEAQTKVLEGVTRRRVGLAQAKLEQDAAIVSLIAQEKVELEKLNRAVKAEVRRFTSVEDVAASRLGDRRQREGVQLAELRQQSPQDYSRAASVSIEERRRKTEISLAEQNELRTAAGRALMDAEQRATRLTAESAAVKAEMRAVDSAYISATVRQAKAKEELNARTVLARSGETDPAGGREALIARAAVLRRAEADTRAAAAAQQTSEAEIQATVQKKVAEARLNSAIRQREKELVKQAIRNNELGGTGFQRLQAGLSPSSGRTPQEFSTFGQFVGQKLTTTAGYAAAGAITGALVFGVKGAIDQAEELQQTFALLKSQLEGIGKGDQFGKVSDEIRGIAADTGVSTEKVAEFAARLVGVFRDPDKALRETAAAMKLSVVTGIEFGTLLQDLVPIASQFSVSIEEIGDLAVAIRERFGITEAAITDFLGRTAAVATQAGLSMEEMAVIGSAAANSLGKDMGSIADLMAKVLPGLSEAQDKIFAVYSSRPETASLVDPLAEKFGAGDTGGAFKEILASYGKLDSVQKKYLVNSIAERREAPLLAAVLSKHTDIIDELSGGHLKADATAGKLNGRFKNLQDTVKNAEERIKEALNQLGEALFNSGLSNIFYEIGSAIRSVVALMGGVVGAFGKLDDATKFITKLGGFDDGFLRLLVEYGAIALIAAKAIGVLAAARSGDAAASTISSRAIGRLIGVKTVDSTASTDSAIAEGTLTVARTSGTAAAGAQAAAVAQLGGVGAVNSASAVQGLYGAPTAAKVAKYGVSAKLLQGGRFLTVSGADAAATAATGAATGASAAGIGALAFAGALAVKSSYDTNQEGLKAQAENLAQKIKGKDRKRLQGLLDDYRSNSNSLLDSLHETFFRVDLPTTQIQNELNRQDSEKDSRLVGGLQSKDTAGRFAKEVSDPNLQLLTDFFNQSKVTKRLGREVGFDTDGRTFKDFNYSNSVKVTRDKVEQAIPELRKRAEEGDVVAGAALDAYEKVLTGQKSLSDLARDAQKAASEGDIDKAIELAGGGDKFVIQTFAEAKQGYELGHLTPAEYLNQIKRQKAILDKQLDGKSPAEKAKAQLEIFKIDKDNDQVIEQAIQNRMDAIKASVATSGTSTPKTDQLRVSLQFFRSQNKLAQYAALPKLLQDNFEAWQERLDTIADPVARANAEAQGVEVPAELRQTAIRQQLGQDTAAAEQIDKITVLAKSLGEATDPEKTREELAKLATELNITIAEAAKRYIEKRLAPVREIFGEAEYQSIVADYASQFTAGFANIDTPPDVQKTQENDREKRKLAGILNDQKGALDLEAAQAGDDSVAQARLNVGQALATLNEVQARFTQGLGATQGELDQARAGYIRAQRDQAKAMDDVTRANLEWAVVLANGDPIRENAGKMAIAQFDLSAALANNDPKAVIGAQQEIQRLQFELADQNNALADALLNITAATVERDPVAAAQIALQQADQAVATAKGDEAAANAVAERIRAQHQLEDAVNAANASYLDVTAAVVERDPLASARIALEKANQAAALAEGVASQNQAEADRIRAQHQLEDAIDAVVQSQADLAIAIANAAGDTVEAARLSLSAAKDKLDQALSRGADPQGAEVNGLRQDVVGKNAALRDATVAERTSEIDFLQQMGRMTTGQVIAAYQALLQYPALTEPMRRDIELKIHGLLASAKADYQFNLPSNLNLPTLYEARRATQTPGGPGAYTDNRQVSVTVNVNNANDLAAVERMLGDNLGTNRFATVSKRY